MDRAPSASNAHSDIVFMLVSAAAFAYFGFASSWAHQYTNTTPPVLIPMIVVLKWTLRGGAIAFLLAALLSMVKPSLGSLVYSVVGLATAALFIVVAIWEWTNPQGYYSGVPPVLLVLFAIWNGYGSWAGIRDLLAMRGKPSAGERPFGIQES
jgi:hypothetical protein